MRDFPMFPTESGVASLVLREIPYKKEAYLTVLDVQPGALEELVSECVSFCKMAGAERVYAAGHDGLSAYPLFTKVLQMRMAVVRKEHSTCLFPVTEQTVGTWRDLYNQKMTGVHNARTLEKRDEEKLLEACGACFVHEAGTLLGIGWVQADQLLALASVVPGAGERVLTALMDLVQGDQLLLEVASDNAKAIGLYQRMGFVTTAEVSAWYEVTEPIHSIPQGGICACGETCTKTEK